MSWFTSIRDTVENVVAAPAIALGGGNTVKGLQAVSAQNSGLQNVLNKPEQISSDVVRGAAVVGGAILAAPFVASGAAAVGITGAGIAATAGQGITSFIGSSPHPSSVAAVPTANTTPKNDYIPLLLAGGVAIASKVI